MVTPFTVLLAGITGGAFAKHPGILPPDNLHHFFMGLVMASKRDVLALQETIGGGTGGADLFFPFQGIHKDLLFRFSGQALTLRTTVRRITPILHFCRNGFMAKNFKKSPLKASLVTPEKAERLYSRLVSGFRVRPGRAEKGIFNDLYECTLDRQEVVIARSSKLLCSMGHVRLKDYIRKPL
jgi:hypothetical protein